MKFISARVNEARGSQGSGLDPAAGLQQPGPAGSNSGLPTRKTSRMTKLRQESQLLIARVIADYLTKQKTIQSGLAGTAQDCEGPMTIGRFLWPVTSAFRQSTERNRNHILRRQQVIPGLGTPTTRLIYGKREIDIYRNGLMFERDHVVGVRGTR
jgi:hypothetical protein